MHTVLTIPIQIHTHQYATLLLCLLTSIIIITISTFVTTGAVRVVGLFGGGVKGTNSFGPVGDSNGGVLLDMVESGCCLH